MGRQTCPGRAAGVEFAPSILRPGMCYWLRGALYAVMFEVINEIMLPRRITLLRRSCRTPGRGVARRTRRGLTAPDAGV